VERTARSVKCVEEEEEEFIVAFKALCTLLSSLKLLID
jgi:hypothetical protein